jgi:hypothetical protein
MALVEIDTAGGLIGDEVLRIAGAPEDASERIGGNASPSAPSHYRRSRLRARAPTVARLTLAKDDTQQRHTAHRRTSPA